MVSEMPRQRTRLDLRAAPAALKTENSRCCSRTPVFRARVTATNLLDPSQAAANIVASIAADSVRASARARAASADRDARACLADRAYRTTAILAWTRGYAVWRGELLMTMKLVVRRRARAPIADRMTNRDMPSTHF